MLCQPWYADSNRNKVGNTPTGPPPPAHVIAEEDQTIGWTSLREEGPPGRAPYQASSRGRERRVWKITSPSQDQSRFNAPWEVVSTPSQFGAGQSQTRSLWCQHGGEAGLTPQYLTFVGRTRTTIGAGRKGGRMNSFIHSNSQAHHSPTLGLFTLIPCCWVSLGSSLDRDLPTYQQSQAMKYRLQRQKVRNQSRMSHLR